MQVFMQEVADGFRNSRDHRGDMQEIMGVMHSCVKSHVKPAYTFCPKNQPQMLTFVLLNLGALSMFVSLLLFVNYSYLLTVSVHSECIGISYNSCINPT